MRPGPTDQLHLHLITFEQAAERGREQLLEQAGVGEQQ